MEPSEQMNLFKEFFENYKKELYKQIVKGENYIIIDFSKILSFNQELAQNIIETPEETIRLAEIAIEQLDVSDLTSKPIKNFRVRLTNIPKTQEILIQDIRSKHIGKLLFIEGIVKQKTDVRPQIVSARFECPKCGAVIPVIQTESTFREPGICHSCGHRGKFKLLGKELVDAQAMVIEEVPEKLEGGEQPKRMNVLLKEDLVSPLSDKRTNPGSRIGITGYIKEVPIIGRGGKKSTRYDYILEANNIEISQEDFFMIEFSEEEIKEIKELSKKENVYEILIDAIAPSIFGHEKIKEALILQLFGGVEKLRNDGVRTRGDIHVLLVGDPGAGKSQMLKRISKVAPKSRYVSGKGASGAGLTASVVRDEFLGGFSLEAGALVLANRGIVLIDEMDKMSKEDTSAMHEAMEQQTISISKANIQATLPSKTTVLAAANPKFGRFDSYQNLFTQIDMPPALINRFDLIFIVRDLPDPESDKRMAKHILNLHKNPEVKSIIDDKLLRKYFAYAKQNVKPELTEEALEEIQNYYVKMRNQTGDSKTIPLSARQLEALVRLAEASAKTRLDDKVLKKDAERAINLLHYCLTQVATDETGKIDIDKITTGITSSTRNKIYMLKKVIEELEEEIGNKIPKKDIEERAKMKGIDPAELDELLTKLIRSGDIYEPSPGTYSRLI